MWWNWVLGWVLQEHQLAPMGNSTARTLDMLRSSCILLESMTGSAVTTFYFSHLFLDLREPFNMSFTNFWSVLGPIRWKSLPGLMNYSLLYSYQDQLDESLYHDLWIIHYWVVTRLLTNLMEMYVMNLGKWNGAHFLLLSSVITASNHGPFYDSRKGYTRIQISIL